MSTKFKCQKQFYFKQFSLVNKVKWFQVLLRITNNSIKHQSYVYTELNVKTVLFQTIQFCLNTQFSSIWPIDRTLSGDTNPGQNGNESDDNESVLCSHQISSIAGASLSDCLVSYRRHFLGDSTAEMQLMYSGPCKRVRTPATYLRLHSD